jgi:hypothetical protein
MEDLEGGVETEAFAGPVVELADIAGEFRRSDLRQVGAFGQILAQQAIGVLVGAPLPGVVGMGEVDRQLEFLFEFEGTGEFPLTWENDRQALEDLGVAKEQYDATIAKGKSFRVYGAHHLVRGRGGQGGASVITLYAGHRPDTVYHEFGHPRY